jgi:hypothetical protein
VRKVEEGLGLPETLCRSTEEAFRIRRKTKKLFLKVTPYTAFGKAMKTKKLQPRFVGPYQILRRIGPVAYQLALPPHLSNLLDAFHVSQL